MVPYGTIWYHMVPYGTIWYHTVPYGTIRYHMVFHFSIFQCSMFSIFPKLSIFHFQIVHCFIETFQCSHVQVSMLPFFNQKTVAFCNKKQKGPSFVFVCNLVGSVTYHDRTIKAPFRHLGHDVETCLYTVTICYHMVPYGTFWYHMVPYDTIW